MKPKAPWHLWVVGVLGLLWNASGAAVIFLSQAGRYPGLSAEEAAYYAGQPLLLVLVTDIALLGSVFACVALLLRSRWAVPLFTVSLAAIVVSNLWDLLSGDRRMLANAGALVATCLILVIAVLLLVYARRQRANGVIA